MSVVALIYSAEAEDGRMRTDVDGRRATKAVERKVSGQTKRKSAT